MMTDADRTNHYTFVDDDGEQNDDGCTEQG